MPLALNDIFLVTFRGECSGQTILNTFHYRINGLTPGHGLSDIQAQNLLADALTAGGADILQTAFLECLPNNYDLTEVWVQKIFPTRYRKTVEVEAATGVITDPALTTNIAAVISRFGQEANRHNIGSLHVGPLPTEDAWYVNGEVTGAYKTKLIALGGAMLEEVDLISSSGISFLPCLFAAVGTPLISDVVTTVAQDTVRTMRRRTVRVGI